MTFWKYSKYILFEVQIFKGSGFSCNYSHGLSHLKAGPFEIWTFLSGIQMVLDKMAAIYPDRFRIPYEIGTIVKQTFFGHSKAIRSPLYPQPPMCKASVPANQSSLPKLALNNFGYFQKLKKKCSTPLRTLHLNLSTLKTRLKFVKTSLKLRLIFF